MVPADPAQQALLKRIDLVAQDVHDGADAAVTLDGLLAKGVRLGLSLGLLAEASGFTRAAIPRMAQRGRSVYWTHCLTEGGAFPVGVPLRIRRCSNRREAEVRPPNGPTRVEPEGVLVHSYHAPDGFESWVHWLSATQP
ncbi:MAG: hypothetical protein E6J41_26365 [Chloroflexi bacterium]|nr:MAG: hypothetical protein E6J41_26365 [Chloroflexota bacterium]